MELSPGDPEIAEAMSEIVKDASIRVGLPMIMVAVSANRSICAVEIEGLSCEPKILFQRSMDQRCDAPLNLYFTGRQGASFHGVPYPLKGIASLSELVH